MSAPFDHRNVAPYTSKDMAAICGVSLGCFYKRRGRYEMLDGLPKPYKTGCWDRASVDAWRARNHPSAPPRPANDPAPPLMPDSVDKWREHLHQVYAPPVQP